MSEVGISGLYQGSVSGRRRLCWRRVPEVSKKLKD